jgi:putative chitinase
MVTSDDLRKIAKTKSKSPVIDDIAAAFNKYAAEHDVVTPVRIGQFLANISVETRGFTALVENLNYSADALKTKFARYRISAADADKYGRTKTHKADQRAIANLIYGGNWGRKNLGNTLPNDGWNFRGSGPGQITGRANFEEIQTETGFAVVANPELLRAVDTGMKAALILWEKRGLNELADKGLTDDIRRKWNGGTNGLAEVRLAVGRASKLNLSVPGAPAAVTTDAADDVSDELPGINVATQPLIASEIKELQSLLASLGYTEVGKADGIFGSRTRGAILAFEADNSLPLTGAATVQVLQAATNAHLEGKFRQVAPERAGATKGDIAEKPAVSATDALRRIGAGVLASSGVGALLDGSGDLQKVVDSANKLKALAETVLSLSPWLLGGIAGLAAIYYGKSVVSHLVEEYRGGRLL